MDLYRLNQRRLPRHRQCQRLPSRQDGEQQRLQSDQCRCWRGLPRRIPERMMPG